MTRNPVSSLRYHLLEETLSSLEVAFPDAERVLLDNGSDDGSDNELAKLAGKRWTLVSRCGAENTTPGAGRNVLLGYVTTALDAFDTVVLSDDDMRWHADAGELMADFWAEAPNAIVLCSGYMEPDYKWSKPLKAVKFGKARALIRESCPGCSWTMRYQDWQRRIGPVVEEWGYDSTMCATLRKRDLHVAAADWSDHLGTLQSTHGNRPELTERASPIDRTKWPV